MIELVDAAPVTDKVRAAAPAAEPEAVEAPAAEAAPAAETKSEEKSE